MLYTQHHSVLRGSIDVPLIRDYHARSNVLLLAQPPLGRYGSAAALNQDVEHNALLADGSPELPTRDIHHDLVPILAGAGL